MESEKMESEKISNEEFKKLRKKKSIKEISRILRLPISRIYYLYSDAISEFKFEKNKELYDNIKKSACEGLQKTQAIKKHKINSGILRKLVGEFGEIEFKKKNDNKERDIEIIKLLKSGMNNSEVGKRFDLSRERVRQIKYAKMFD
jgi:DNA-binding CsgD family transcriptional regulator